MAPIPVSERSKTYTPVNQAGPFPIDFPLFDESGADLFVTLNDVEVSGWTFSGTLESGFYGEPNTWVNGSILFNTNITGTLVISGDRQPRRTLQFAEGRGVPARDLNAELNIITATLQEIKRTLNAIEQPVGSVSKRYLRSPAGELLSQLPAAAARAFKYLGFGANGDVAMLEPTPVAVTADTVEYSTAAAVAGAVIPAELKFLRTAGNLAVGDGKGRLYVRASSEPNYADKLRSADRFMPDGSTDNTNGGWWRPDNPKVMTLLWTGQSNASQPFVTSGTPDTISPFARIWSPSDNAFVPLQAGKSGILAGATNHSLFTFSNDMIVKGGFDRVDIIMSALGGRPISDWSGTPADRTVSVGNRPRMKDIIDQVAASGIGSFTHVAMVQGEENANDYMFPLSVDSTYIAQREFFRSDMVSRGLAGPDTRWLEGELLRRDVSALTYRANAAITRLNQIGRDNVAIVSSQGLLGQNEGLTFNFQGKIVPYTLHFSALENSEYGRRMALAAMDLDTRKPRAVVSTDQNLLTRRSGIPGHVRPWLDMTNVATNLSAEWARGGVIRIIGTCNVTLQSDDLRLGGLTSQGYGIVFLLAVDATLNLTTETVRIYNDATGGFTQTLTRHYALKRGILELWFDGDNWLIMRDGQFG